MKVTLKALRTNFGLKQYEMADMIGVSKETLSNYEKGKTFPNQKTIKIIEDKFNITYDDIIFLPKVTVKP